MKLGATKVYEINSTLGADAMAQTFHLLTMSMVYVHVAVISPTACPCWEWLNIITHTVLVIICHKWETSGLEELQGSVLHTKVQNLVC